MLLSTMLIPNQILLIGHLLAEAEVTVVVAEDEVIAVVAVVVVVDMLVDTILTASILMIIRIAQSYSTISHFNQRLKSTHHTSSILFPTTKNKP